MGVAPLSRKHETKIVRPFCDLPIPAMKNGVYGTNFIQPGNGNSSVVQTKLGLSTKEIGPPLRREAGRFANRRHTTLTNPSFLQVAVVPRFPPAAKNAATVLLWNLRKRSVLSKRPLPCRNGFSFPVHVILASSATGSGPPASGRRSRLGSRLPNAARQIPRFRHNSPLSAPLVERAVSRTEDPESPKRSAHRVAGQHPGGQRHKDEPRPHQKINALRRAAASLFPRRGLAASGAQWETIADLDPGSFGNEGLHLALDSWCSPQIGVPNRRDRSFTRLSSGDKPQPRGASKRG
jgi:hypothetical protein